VSLIQYLREGLSDEPSPDRPAGIEVRQALAPAAEQPVMPPSYEGELEIHARHVDGETREVIELDSVGSSANRAEEGLLADHRAGRYPLPVSSVLLEAGGQSTVITTLEAPHRVFDAWIRLAVERGSDVPFERTALGRELSLAPPHAPDPIAEVSTHDLLFGTWDSHRTGPGGQVRIARSFTSTVIGLDPKPVRTVAARRDPLNLGKDKEIKAPKGMKLSEQGLSSIPPQRRRLGVSVSGARFIGFLSFAALRRLRFERYDDAAVRVALAALCLRGLLQREAAGWSLRSECELVPQSGLELCVVRGAGHGREAVALGLDDSLTLLQDAARDAAIRDRSVQLVGGPQLTPLVEKALAADKPTG